MQSCDAVPRALRCRRLLLLLLLRLHMSLCCSSPWLCQVGCPAVETHASSRLFQSAMGARLRFLTTALRRYAREPYAYAPKLDVPLVSLFADMHTITSQPIYDARQEIYMAITKAWGSIAYTVLAACSPAQHISCVLSGICTPSDVTAPVHGRRDGTIGLPLTINHHSTPSQTSFQLTAPGLLHSASRNLTPPTSVLSHVWLSSL
jgi:hypothetical protein